MSHLRVRTLFLSDLHLGSRGCRAEELVRFLKCIRCDTLYLVGDVIDMWRLRQRWYWPEEHNEVVRRLLKMAHKGTRVVFVPGNHDEWARQFPGLAFGGVELHPHDVHVTMGGKRLLVIHGDQYDLVVRNHPLISLLGARAYDSLIVVNRWYNAARRRLGLPYRSLSQAVKSRVKTACTVIGRFEETLVGEAKRRGVDGVVCGHIHKAEMRVEDGIEYVNCGDWVESCSAVVEHVDGELELLDGLRVIAEHGHRVPDEPIEPITVPLDLGAWIDPAPIQPAASVARGAAIDPPPLRIARSG